MDRSKRTVLIRWLWFIGFLLAAVIVFYLGAFPPSGILVWAFILLIVSTIAAIRAIAAGIRLPAGRKRAVLLSSITSLAFLFAQFAGVVMLIVPGLLASAVASVNQGDGEDVGALASFLLLFAFEAIVGGVAIIEAIGAVSVALSSAAKSGQRGWFLTMLWYLIGSLLLAVALFVALGQNVTSDIHVQAILVIVALVPLLALPILTLLYSLSGREGSKGT